MIANGASAALADPLLTEITIFEYVPAAVGVPDSVPVAMLKVAQAGMFWTLKESAAPASLACGVKAYAVPTVSVVAGVPVMLGGALTGGGAAAVAADTLMVKGASDAAAKPSLTLITMLREVPALALVGVPESCPVVLLKLAQEGLP